MARARSMAKCSPEASRGYRDGAREQGQEAQCDVRQGGGGSRSTSSGGSESNRGRVTAECRVCSRLAKAGPGGTLVCTDGAVESWRLAVGGWRVSDFGLNHPLYFLGDEFWASRLGRESDTKMQSTGPATTVARPIPTSDRIELGRQEDSRVREDQRKSRMTGATKSLG